LVSRKVESVAELFNSLLQRLKDVFRADQGSVVASLELRGDFVPCGSARCESVHDWPLSEYPSSGTPTG
jgi:hypothetical protein